MRMNKNNQKIRAVFVLPALTAGGAERVLLTLMNGLDRDVFAPTLITATSGGDLHSLIADDIAHHDLKSPSLLRSLIPLYGMLKAQRPDLVISTMAHMNFILLVLKPLFPHTKFVVREAITPSFLLDERPKVAPLLKLAYKALYASADLVISPAQAIIDEFKDLLHMKCKNHKLLHNPVDVVRTRADEDEKIVVTPERKKTVHFVAAGRLHKQKGFDALIAALPRLEMPYDWRLDIWGKGEEHEALQALIDANNLGDKVKLMGHSQAPWPHYAAADCFLMPSRWEGLPNVILESLSCGTPAIATASSGGVAEIQKYSGSDSLRIVSDIDGFIEAMSEVAPSPAPAFRSSLLPDYFVKEAVLVRFTEMLMALNLQEK